MRPNRPSTSQKMAPAILSAPPRHLHNVSRKSSMASGGGSIFGLSDLIYGKPAPPPPTPPTNIPYVMTMILVAQLAFLAALYQLLTPAAVDKTTGKAPGTWLPSPQTAQGEKLAYERFVLRYTPFWIGVFAVIVGCQLYEGFTAHTYMAVCVGLCLPLFAYPFLPGTSPRPLAQRYAVKATAWLAIYSHIGNYWYTHYFYDVLKASYSMPSWRLNDVPIPLYFATFFYFSTYHVLSNALLRRVVSGFTANAARSTFLVALVVALSYLTAFMETLTISSFPYYSFQDRAMAYTVGSAFYGIYFLVSFPAFFRLDESPHSELSLYQACMDSLGAGMLILILLDAVRLALGIPLTIPGKAFSF